VTNLLSTWTIIVAAGRAERFGTDKQLADLAGRTVLERSIDAASGSKGIVVVTTPSLVASVSSHFAGEMVDVVVAGGATRTESVRAGLAAVPNSANIVLVHDGARPLASRHLFECVVNAVQGGAEAVVPGVQVSDSLRSADGIVDREGLFIVQTPQGFPAAILRDALSHNGEANDEATLVEANGGTVVMVEGEAENIKITWPIDLFTARQFLENRGG